MHVYVYKSSRKQGYYVYLATKDKFDSIPDAMQKKLGDLELTLEFTLSADRKLAREDPVVVLENLQKQGFHLQIGDVLVTPDDYKLR